MTIARDGSAVTAFGGTGTLALPTLTTSNGSGQIVVAIGANTATAITSVTATGLTFTARTSQLNTFGWGSLVEYVAPYTTNFSGVITINGAATPTSAIAQAYSGVPTSSPFDGSPATSTNPPTTKTTTNANDVVISINGTSANDTAGTGWTLVLAQNGNTNKLLMQDQIVSVTGNYTGNTSGGFTNGNIVDAMIAAATVSADQTLQAWSSLGRRVIMIGAG